MDIPYEIIAATGLVLFCLIAWGLNLIALPGNWLAVAAIAMYAWIGPEEGRTSISWWILVAVFLIAVIGELLEFAAGALGAKRAGASRRTTVLAIVGSVAGALLGAVIGVPIPVVGPILAAVLFGAFGATAGAMFGEWTDGKSWRDSWTVGHAAFWGRLLGTLGKVAAGFLIVLCILFAVAL